MTKQSVIKKRERKPEARPAQIMDAALALFSEKGFAATRMDEVSALAGLSKGALYLYFPDKVALLKALVQETAGSVIGAAAMMISAHQGPVAPLLPMILGFVGEKLETTNIASVIKLVLSEGRAHPEIGRAYLDNVIGRAFPLMESLIARGMASGEFRNVDAAMTVRSLIAPMLLAAFWKSTFEPLGAEPLSARALAAHHADLILRALKP
jgi:AcrR family transcriptional regulator